MARRGEIEGPDVVIVSTATLSLAAAVAPLYSGKIRDGGGWRRPWLQLVHPGVGEVERGVVHGHHGAGRPRCVRLGLEEADEGLPDPGGWPVLHRRAGGSRGCSVGGEVDGAVGA